MAVNPVDAMTWKARELKISYGILLTQITEERQEILEEYEIMSHCCSYSDKEF